MAQKEKLGHDHMNQEENEEFLIMQDALKKDHLKDENKIEVQEKNILQMDPDELDPEKVELKSNFLSEMNLLFQKIEHRNKKSQNFSPLPVNGMWKIEGADLQKGGLMTWDGNYLLKHLTSGKYLRGVVIGKKEIDGKIQQKFMMELSFELDERCLFEFKPI